MVMLGPIDFQFGLSIYLNLNTGQNKFEVDILKCSQNSQIKAKNRPDATLVIFYPISTFFILNSLFFETNRMVSKSKL